MPINFDISEIMTGIEQREDTYEQMMKWQLDETSKLSTFLFFKIDIIAVYDL